MAVICSKQLKVPILKKLASDYTVGESVYLMENGSPAEYLIVNQGIPSDMYDSSCNGTWLLRKDCYVNMVWDATNNDYANSDMHTYLNGDFMGLFDASVQSTIKQVKIPYRAGSGTGTTVNSGANGLSTKVFLLSRCEIGVTKTLSDGSPLGYFSDYTFKVANYQGSACEWWLRSPFCDSTGYGSKGVSYIVTTGNYGVNGCTSKSYVRPALILPFDATFNPDTNMFIK